MLESSTFSTDYHWLQDFTKSLDVGLIVLDLDYRVVLWNDFMANHHGSEGSSVLNKEVFELFEDLPEAWFRQKVNAVLQFNGRAFTTWEQRPYVFRMNHYRPFTSPAPYMYQNITIVPLIDISGKNTHVGIIIYDVTDVALQKQQLQSAKDELGLLAKTDSLTGLYNRGYWHYCLEAEFDRYRRTRQVPSLMILDIDHFKRVNDTYGHPAGDQIIVMLADLLKARLRATDVIGRLGGEEFGVILIDAGAEAGEMLANRIRQAVEETVTVHGGEEIRITTSFGITELNADYVDQKHWFATADRALYDSKENGRNQVTVRTPVEHLADPTPQS